MSEKENYEVCKGILLQEHIKSDLFRDSISNKLIEPAQEGPFPFHTFGIPSDYFDIREALISFLDKEVNLSSVGDAYQELSRRKLKLDSKRGKEVLKETL